MKKVYIKPTTTVAMIQTTHIVCESPQTYDMVSTKSSYTKERGSDSSDDFDELW